MPRNNTFFRFDRIVVVQSFGLYCLRLRFPLAAVPDVDDEVLHSSLEVSESDCMVYLRVISIGGPDCA